MSVYPSCPCPSIPVQLPNPCCPRPPAEELVPWRVGDFTIAQQFPSNTNFATHDLFYNSQLALRGELFRFANPLSDLWSPYRVPVTQSGLNLLDTYPIPGAALFERDYSWWTGNVKYGDGQYRLPQLAQTNSIVGEDALGLKLLLRRELGDAAIGSFGDRLADKSAKFALASVLKQLLWVNKILAADGNFYQLPLAPSGAFRSGIIFLAYGESDFDMKEFLTGLRNLFALVAPASALLLTPLLQFVNAQLDIILLGRQARSIRSVLLDQEAAALALFDAYRHFFRATRFTERLAALEVINAATAQLFDANVRGAAIILAGMFVSVALSVLASVLGVPAENNPIAAGNRFSYLQNAAELGYRFSRQHFAGARDNILLLAIPEYPRHVKHTFQAYTVAIQANTVYSTLNALSESVAYTLIQGPADIYARMDGSDSDAVELAAIRQAWEL